MSSDRLERMRANPAGDWTVSDVEAICRERGFRCKPPRGGGSHYKVSHPSRRAIFISQSGDPYGRRIFAASQTSSPTSRPRFGMPDLQYPVLVEPLSADDGGGFMATVPDLPDCSSDGDTAAEALINVQSAIAEWIEEAEELRYPIPLPSQRRAGAE